VTVTSSFTADDLHRQSQEFEIAPASAVIRWAVESFGPSLLLAASMQDAVLIDIATQVDPTIEVLFIDTGDHFPETYATVEAVRSRYDLNLRVVRVPEPAVAFHITDPVRCCSDAKVAALDAALAGRVAWMSGLRRAEAATRAESPIVGLDRRGLVKINPLATWSDLDVRGYIAANEVPYNPLLDAGYLSIGCQPTTKPVAPGDHPRAGRWSGSDKAECGIHE